MNDGNEFDDLSTDEEILNSMGEGDEPDTDESAEEEDNGEEQGAEKKSADANDKQGTVGGTNEEQGSRKPSGPQDLVDAQGNVIAAGGKERRFYETAQREKQRADTVSRQLETASARLDAFEKAGSVGTQYSLTPDEVVTGAQLIAAYKNNPVEAIKYMLTQAQANGHNVDDLMGGGTNMSAIKQMIENAVAPLTADHKQREDTQAVNSRAQEIYNGFIGKYPDSTVHEESLSRLIQNDPSLSLDAAYFQLKSYYLERGLNWNKSLVQLQQEQELAARQPAQTRVNTQPQPPEGRVNQVNTTTNSRVADVSTSTDDIIRQAMLEAGIN